MSDTRRDAFKSLSSNVTWKLLWAAHDLAVHDDADDKRNGLEPSVELERLKRVLFDAKFSLFGNPEVEWWWEALDFEVRGDLGIDEDAL